MFMRESVVKNTGLYPVFAESCMKNSDWSHFISLPVGYLGSHRNEVIKRYDESFGKENWRVVWFDKEKKKILDFQRMCTYYERSYHMYLEKNPEPIEFLQSRASNVCAEDASDLESDCNYLIQNGKRTQLLAIAIRNVMSLMKKEFCGQELIYLRGPKMVYRICEQLDPKVVPFCNPEKIFDPWYGESERILFSVEDFYQNNRFLQIRRKK